MNIARIVVLPLPSVECVVALAPTITALKRKFPNSAVGLVADEGLREASHLIPELDFFLTSQEELMPADHVIDLRGTEVDNAPGESRSWKAYLHAMNEMEAGNPYHLVDLLRKASQVDTVDVNFDLLAPEVMEEPPQALSEAKGLRVAVCMSLLASEELDCVVSGLAALQNGAEIFLLGSLKDRAAAAELVSRYQDKLPIHDTCGHYGLSMNAFLLRNCDIAITGPGLHSILGSGYGTFTICVDTKPARGPALYPYGHGHLVIQNPAAHPLAKVLGEIMEKTIHYALTANQGSVPTLEQWQAFADGLIDPYLGRLRILATQRIEIVFKDGGSFTELYSRPLLFAGSEIHDVMQTFYRLLWEHSLNQRSITTYDLEVLHQDTMPILCDLLKPLEQLYELGNFGKTYSSYVREALAKGDLAKARHDSERLQEVEELIYSLSSTQPFFSPLCAYHRKCQALLDAHTPLSLSDEMTTLFAGLQSQVLVLLDLARTLFHTVFENENSLVTKSIEEGSLNG